MSKAKTAAAFALGFIVGSSKWLWVSILASGVLYFLSSFSLSSLDTHREQIGAGLLCCIFGFILGLAVPSGSGTENTGPR